MAAAPLIFSSLTTYLHLFFRASHEHGMALLLSSAIFCLLVSRSPLTPLFRVAGPKVARLQRAAMRTLKIVLYKAFRKISLCLKLSFMPVAFCF